MRTAHDNGHPDESALEGTEKQLRDSLEALAGEIHAAPDAYRTARGEWLRRERRRRLVLALLIAVVFTLATLVGLLILNQSPSQPSVIFNDADGTSVGQVFGAA
ncbi:hypothetical protein ACIQFZ_29195 [Streptomyces sp. NPDC093064]|uniref:hypothetical protein n=1 Tax=Streptomyces sp. NPDC093064 TaxID=3366020 RepID=UPI0037F87032